MLVRLEMLEGVDHAEIDRAGKLVRLSLRDERALGPSIALLQELGYAAERASDIQAEAVSAWYGTTSVGDLSRVEAGVIADRVVPAFADGRMSIPEQTERLRAAVVDALHTCFVSHALTSAASSGDFRLACLRAVEERARPIVGPEPARELAQLLDIDLSQNHRQQEPARG